MRSRLLPALVAGALTATLLGAQTASAEPREVSGPSLPPQASQTAAEHAADALAQAQALFAEKSPAAARRQATGETEATMVLRELLRVREDLTPADRREADRLLARPTPDGDEIFGSTVIYDNGEATPVCGPVICVHYANGPDTDAPPTTDTSPANGVPDAVDRTLATAEDVHDTYLASGYRSPDPDGALGGGSDMVDVYLADVGAFGLYGYCTSDQGGNTDNRWAYCVVDDDFNGTQFPSHTSLENLQVTLAHEYFHAVQFAYDAFEDGWITEATATWAEEQLYDDVDDNRQYLDASQISIPYESLDRYESPYHYGNWIYFQFLTERWDATTGTMPTLVLDLWKRMSGRAGAPDNYSTQALQWALDQRGTDFTTVYGQFADGNRRPAKTYSEGGAAAYDPIAPALTKTLSSSKRSTGRYYARIDHLTSLPVRLKPASGLTKSNWKVRVKVDMPAGTSAPVARVAVYKKSGSVSTSALRFKSSGFSSKVVGFSARDVKYVELVLVNASRRTNCGTDPDYWFACSGTPKDDGRRFDFNASIFRG